MPAHAPLHILDRKVPDYEQADVQLRGELPEWLRGTLFRTAAACFAEGAWRATHLFDALCAIYAFDIEGGRVRYRQRMLESTLRARLKSGSDDTPHFFTAMRRKPLARLLSPVPRYNDNTNVNVLPLANDLVAMTESNMQHGIDRQTLQTRGHVRYDDEYKNRLFMLAHPRLDRARELIVNVATELSAKPGLAIYEQKVGEAKRRIVARIPLRELPYVHSFGLTPKHVVLFAGPLLLTPWRLLFSDRGYIRHFHHRPERGSRLYVIDRGSGEVRTHTAPPYFVFHVIHAFERGEETVFDALAYDDPGVIDTLAVESLRARWPNFDGRALRFVARRGREQVSVEPLNDQRFEFPTLHEQATEGNAYRFAWGASGYPDGGTYRSAIVRLDGQSGEVTRFEESGFVFGEPLFVPRPDARDEGDGVLLTVAPHSAEARSAFVVLDARSLSVRAWGEVPLPVPFSFHGCFLTAQA